MAEKHLTVDHISTKNLIRIFSKIFIHPDLQWNNTPCWIWTGYRTDGGGYGQIHWKGKTSRIHRLMYVWATGIPLPTNPQVNGWIDWVEPDHLCGRTSCCNPVHIEAVNRRENLLRGNGVSGKSARRKHCVRGHLFDKTSWAKQGGRVCAQCNRDRTLAAYYRQKDDPEYVARKAAIRKAYRERKKAASRQIPQV